jgi:hypothetical protein
MDQEHDQIGDELGRARLSALGEVRDREGPDDEQRRDRADVEIELAVLAPERPCEAEEQVREEDERGDVDAGERLLDEELRVLGERAADEHDERDRAERRRRPSGGAVVARAPLPDRNHAERGVRNQVDVAEYLGRGVQGLSRTADEL